MPVAYVRGHNPASGNTPDYEVREGPLDTPCWEWLRFRDDCGYGVYYDTDHKRHRKAHRVSYERSVGAVGNGLELDHLCRNRACVNPDHLEPVPHAVNVQRGAKAKLSADDAAEIRRLAQSAPIPAVAAMFGVDRGTAWRIVAEKSWKVAA